MPAKIDTKKLTAYIRVRTGKRVTVIKGTQGPATDGKKIHLGRAVDWTPVERLGALNHEGAHVKFPAAYEKGNYHTLSNMIDDARIERQWVSAYPQDEDSLVVLVINVIANQKYDGDDESFEDRWDAENFGPDLWALLFFRVHLPREVRVAATQALRAYIQDNDLRTEVEDFDDSFRALVEEGLRITRLATVARSTLKAWCDLYMKVFPTATSQPQNEMGQDNQAGTGGKGKDAEGEGSEAQDQKDTDKAAGTVKGDEGEGDDEDEENGEGSGKDGDDEDESKGKGGTGQKKEQEEDSFNDEEADDLEDLEGALENLKNKAKEAAEKAEARAEEDDDGDDDDDDAGQKGVETKDDEDEDEGELDEDYETQEGIGSTPVDTSSRRSSSVVDRSFVNRVRTSIRQLRFVAEDEEEDAARSGRLNMPTVIRGERKGVLPRKPFERTIDNVTEVPVACVVATDFSGSTGSMNAHLNAFLHNALYALQAASCESAGVVWNCSARIVKSLVEEVSPVESRRHSSDGGTDLEAAAKGCVDALKHSVSPRKVAFIFTDGEVYDSEVPVIDAYLKSQGFEAVLIVSLGSSVKRKGIVDSATCTNLGGLANIFEKWVRKQVGKGVNANA